MFFSSRQSEKVYVHCSWKIHYMFFPSHESEKVYGIVFGISIMFFSSPESEKLYGIVLVRSITGICFFPFMKV